VKKIAAALLATIALATSSCATSVPPPPTDLAGEIIVYTPSYGPFCFDCTAVELTVADDGRVWVERTRRVGTLEDWRNENEARWRVQRELVKVTPEQLAAFKSLLAPYRPSGSLLLADDACEVFFTDMPGTTVSWRKNGAEDKLIYDFGCDPNVYAGMKDDLVTAPSLLGIVAPEQTWIATTRVG
jgi:hypothetical protein